LAGNGPCLNRAEEHEREIQRFRRPPRGGAEGGRK
jgi:hypothetical protein